MKRVCYRNGERIEIIPFRDEDRFAHYLLDLIKAVEQTPRDWGGLHLRSNGHTLFVEENGDLYAWTVED